jgi:signal transduction histidine kinase
MLIKPKNHPFRLLLYLEWILLGMTIIGELPWEIVFPFLQPIAGSYSKNLIENSWSISLFLITIFGLMGLYLPTKTTRNKWFYTLLQLLIIALADALGDWGRLGVLYIVVVIRSCLIFPARERTIVTGLVFFFSVFSFPFRFNPAAVQQEFLQTVNISVEQIRTWMLYSMISGAFYYGLTLVFVLLLINALLKEYQSRQDLTLAHEQLRQYSLKIEDQATLHERNRIAREIHDSLGHSLTAQNIQLESALLFCDSNPEKTKIFLERAKDLGVKALSEIRKSVSTLRSDPLQGKSLTSILNNLVDEFCHNSNITPHYTVNLQKPLKPEINIAIYRIIQEALTNIGKHSNATEVTIQVLSQVGWVHLCIEDNGKGFNPQQNTTGFGLRGMEERTATLGGKLHINSYPGSGCQIMVDIPLVQNIPSPVKHL